MASKSSIKAAAELLNANAGGIPADLAASATDLGRVAETAEKQRLAEAERRRFAVAAAVKRWDARMRSTFKGIMPSPERYRMLDRMDVEAMND